MTGTLAGGDGQFHRLASFGRPAMMTGTVHRPVELVIALRALTH